jgi:hypothetical protein
MKKRIVKLSLFVSLFFITACLLNLDFKTSSKLRDIYPYSATGDGIRFFYKVVDNKTVEVSIKNMSNAMYRELDLTISDNTRKLNFYKSFVNVKNYAVRKFVIPIYENTNEITVHYRYLPIAEDSFINPDYRESFEDGRVEGSVKIYVQR